MCIKLKIYIFLLFDYFFSVLTKDPTNLTDADAEEVVEMAIRKRQMLPSSKRWPDTDDIPTPTFLFAHSPHRYAANT